MDHFVKRLNRRYKKHISHINRDAMDMFLAAPWKGNIRELENALERAVLLSDGENLTLANLCLDVPSCHCSVQSSAPVSLKEVVEEAEKRAILQILAETEGNRTAAAKLLGIARRTLYDKLAQYGLE